MKPKFLLTLLSAFFLMASCSSNKEPVVTMTTRYGDIKLVLFDQTPLHKDNFLELARSGAYDSTSFHRIIKGFMIQGGDLVAKGLEEPELIPAEINSKLIHQRGAVAAARRGDQVNPERKSSGSQFYIVDGTKFSPTEMTIDTQKLNQYFGQLVRLEKYKALYEEMVILENAQNYAAIQQKAIQYKDTCEFEFGVELDRKVSPERFQTYTTVGGAPHLDGGYTVFGMVVEGMEVVDQIASIPTNQIDKPEEEVFIKVSVDEIDRQDITLRYGFEFPE